MNNQLHSRSIKGISIAASRVLRVANVRIRVREAMLTVFLGVLLGGAFALPAQANNPTDSQGYIENWPGNVLPEFNSTPLPFHMTVPALSQIVSQSVSPTTLCGQIRDAVAAGLKSALSNWDSCSISPNPEVRGKMLETNELGLKVVFTNISFSFDYHAGGLLGSPTLNVTANMELDATLDFANTIDGSQTDSSSPVNVRSAMVSFSNGKVSTRNAVLSVVNAISDAFGGPNLGQLSTVINQEKLSN
jgi:hypothetical protein